MDQNDIDEHMVVSLAGRRTRQRQHRLQLGGLAQRVHFHVPEDMRMRLLQYFVASRRHCHDLTSLSCAFDASRIACRSTMVGFLATPDGTGLWLPPQAAIVKIALLILYRPVMESHVPQQSDS